MAVIDELQTWLTAVDVCDGARFGADAPERWDALWSALEDIRDPEAQAAAHETWRQHEFFDRFLTYLEQGIRAGIGIRWEQTRVDAAIDLLIRATVTGREGVDSEGFGGRVVANELRNAAELAETRARVDTLTGAIATWPLGPQRRTWAEGARLLGGDGRLTPVGRAFLRLNGREALAFLLELETSLSTGVNDDRRISAHTLKRLVAGAVDFRSGSPDASYRSLRRLAALDVVRHVQDDDRLGRFELAPDAEDLVRAVLDPSPNPYRALVRALLDAERGQLTTELTGVVTAADTDLSYVRLVVHELRNVSFPLKNAVDRLWAELEKPEGPAPERIAELRQRVDRALGRIVDFARDSARLAAVVTEERFPLADAVQAAIAATEPDRNGRIAVRHQLADVHLVGPRGRWTLLFVNLLRNAAQVRMGSGVVEISAERTTGGGLRIFVDDDGPGVPDDLRERVFELGVSQRGGSGIGLHEARTTVLLSGGTITCEDSPLGGARFHIQLPAARVA